MIIVTTPTGQIGHQLVERLLAADAPLRLVARDPGRLDPAVRDRVEVVTGSHGDPAVMAKALDGADALFWLPPPDPTAASLDDQYAGLVRPVLPLLAARPDLHVVTVSALGRGTPWADRAGLVTATLEVDDLVAGTGVATRALANPSFMDNVLRQEQLLRDQGVLVSPLSPDLAAPACATRDIAAVAADLLLDPTWEGCAEVPVLGPADLTGHEMVEVLAEVLGRPVSYQQVPWDAFEQRLGATGMSPAMVTGMVEMMRAKADGLDNGAARAPGNSTPTSFRTWAEQHLA